MGGDDGLFVKAALRDGARGLVYAACGNGSVPEKLTGLLKETVASGVPVVIATRCGGGVVVLSEAMTRGDDGDKRLYPRRSAESAKSENTAAAGTDENKRCERDTTDFCFLFIIWVDESCRVNYNYVNVDIWFVN